MSINNRGHNPRRFIEADFSEFTNGKGFTLEEEYSSTEFFYDQYKGWFDEQGNYYDKDCTPVQNPSKESLEFWKTIKDEYAPDDLVNDYEVGLGFDSGHGEQDNDSNDDYEQHGRQNRQDYKQPQQRHNDNGFYNNNNNNKRQEVTISRNQANIQPKQQSQPQQPLVQSPPLVTATTNLFQSVVVQNPMEKTLILAQTISQNTGDEVTIVITGLDAKETEEAFFKWFNQKIAPKSFVNHRSQTVGDKRNYKFVFKSLLDAEEALLALKLDKLGKVPYKGKYALFCKFDK